jgi:hypothetical protein
MQLQACYKMKTVAYIYIYIYIYMCVCVCVCVYKGKAIPLEALTVPEGSRRLRLPDFKTIGT